MLLDKFTPHWQIAKWVFFIQGSTIISDYNEEERKLVQGKLHSLRSIQNMNSCGEVLQQLYCLHYTLFLFN